jgi:pentatricopeptide repeat protein
MTTKKKRPLVDTEEEKGVEGRECAITAKKRASGPGPAERFRQAIAEWAGRAAGTITTTAEGAERVKVCAARAARTKDLVRANEMLSEFAKAKRLGAAAFVFQQLIEAGAAPTAYTFASFVNACANCDDASLAELAVAAMQDEAFGALRPNVVVRTALVKVLASNGRLRDAAAVVTDMRAEANLRTFNALLRGCMHFGNADVARDCLARMRAAGIEPDASTYDYAAKALAHQGAIEEAVRLVEEMDSRAGAVASPAAYVTLATCLALLGRQSDAKEHLIRAKRVLSGGSGGGDATHAEASATKQ